MRLADAQSTVRTGCAELVAEVVLGGIVECGQEGIALTDRQGQVLLRNALMAYASNADEIQQLLAVDQQVEDLRGGAPSDPGGRSS